MLRIHSFILFVCCVFCVSCSTKWYTHKVGNLPKTTNPEEIVIYPVNKPVDSSYVAIGYVSMIDLKARPELTYGDALEVAKDMVSQSGGEAMSVKKVDKRSSRKPELEFLLALILVESNPETDSLQQLYYEEMDTKIMLLTGKKPIYRVPKHIFYGDIGYGSLSTKILTPDNQELTKLKNGLSYSLGYDWMFTNGIGLGVFGAGYFSKDDFTHRNFAQPVPFSYHQHLLGLKAVARHRFKEKWMLMSYLGMGYGLVTMVTNGECEINAGLGTAVGAGLEYMATPRLGISLSLDVFSMTYDLPDYESDNREKTKFVYMDANVGFIYYF